MPIAIVLRKNATTSLFRDCMITALKAGDGNELILCSGFFQEGGAGTYRASQEPGFINALKSKKISVNVVGVYSGVWNSRFKEFRDQLLLSGVDVTCWRKAGYKWHSKICVLSQDGNPFFAIVGSSNMTRPAFGAATSPVQPPKHANSECDVIMWRTGRGFSDTDNALEKLLGSDKYAAQVIRAPYHRKMNFGLTLKKRLNHLIEEIEGSNLVPLSL